jgi:hypothetical protein
MSRRLGRWLLVVMTLSLATAGVATQAATTPTELIPNFSFRMVRSTAAEARACVPDATGAVSIESLEGVERMIVIIDGLPANTEFDLFVIQLPDAPFGVSWYQGDIETDDNGHGSQTFLGRFNFETFAVAPGSGVAPNSHPRGRFPDATTNPAFNPIHTYHLGLWFNSPREAAAAGCSLAVTPFAGNHRAGIQVLSTRQFTLTNGPLRRIGT